MVARGEAGPGLDVHDYVHGVVEGVLGLALPDGELRARLGVRGISRIGGGATGWYLWTVGFPGALEISLPGEVAGSLGPAVPLALRYFPDPAEPVFARHSPHERDLRASGRFDRTGTPTLSAQDEIGPGLFHVGMLELVPQPGTRIDLRLHAQGRWIDEIEAGSGRVRHRDVPGLRVARVALDTITCALAFVGRQPPERVRTWRQPGALRSFASDGAVAFVPASGIPAWLVEVAGLKAPGGLDGWSGEALPEVDATPHCDHAGTTPPRFPRWPINPAWWQAAGWRFAPTGTFCGHCAAEAAERPVPADHRHACCIEGGHEHAS